MTQEIIKEIEKEFNSIGLNVSCINTNVFIKGNVYVLWFSTDDLKLLKQFLWAGCQRYWSWRQGWRIVLDDGDPNKNAPLSDFCLMYYGEIDDFEGYSKLLIKGIKDYKKDFPEICI